MKKIFLLIIAIITMNNVVNAQWQQTSLINNMNIGVTSLAISDDTIFAGTQNGLYKSNDNGNNWFQVGLSGIEVSTLAKNGNYVFAGTFTNGMFISSDCGSSWISSYIGLTDTVILSITINGSNIFIGTLHGVFLSSDNGSSWTHVGLTNISINALVANGNNILAGEGIVTWDGGEGFIGSVFLSTNNGNTWDTINNGFPTNPYIIVLAINGNNFFAGTINNGIYLSTDNGNSWNAMNVGLNSHCIESIAFIGCNTFIGTEIHGVYMSTNNGLSWTAINNGLDTANVAGGHPTEIQSLVINNSYIFAGLLDQYPNVWRRPLSDFGTYNNINEIKNNTNISIYPNPTKDNLTIETNLNTKQSIEITNLIGQTVYTTYIYNKATINTSAFANGVYILKLSSDKESVVRKFVKE